MAAFDLTNPQATMLWALEPSTLAIPMRDLARKLHCDPSNVESDGAKLAGPGCT